MYQNMLWRPQEGISIFWGWLKNILTNPLGEDANLMYITRSEDVQEVLQKFRYIQFTFRVPGEIFCCSGAEMKGVMNR